MTRILALMFWVAAATAGAADALRMAVTTSFHNSGLADVLLPQIAKDTGIKVQLLVVGTGQALALARAGDVDAILVHSRAAEQQAVAKGYVRHRRQIMYNDFVLVGPSGDPAKIAKAETAADALSRIADQQAVFVSRGDDSGTHRAELALWDTAGFDPSEVGPWYRAVGAGMGAALNVASGMGAYILSDRASWLNFANPGDLALLFSGDPALFNQYSFLPVNQVAHPHVNVEATKQLEAWLTSEVAQSLIDGYRINGQGLFVFNADP